MGKKDSKKQPGTISEHIEAFTKTGKSYGYLQGKITGIEEKNVTKKETGEEFHIHTYILEDGSAYAEDEDSTPITTIGVSIFRDKDEEEPFKVGETLALTDLVATEFKGEIQMKTTKASKVSKKTGGSSAKVTTNKSTTPAAKPTGTGKGTGMPSGNTKTLETVVKNVGGEIVNAINELRVALLDQLKEVIDARFSPETENAENENEQSDTGNEEPTENDQDENGQEEPEGQEEQKT